MTSHTPDTPFPSPAPSPAPSPVVSSARPQADDTSPLRAKVLTVSDGVVAGTRTDTGGPAVARFLEEHGFEVVERRVVADGEHHVALALVELTEGFAGLVVTTGGTGFGPRDETPEGTVVVLERDAPGMAEAMRLVSPLGRLSRGLVGIRGRSIICNTPGSPTGCIEQLGAIVDVLPHALRLLHGTPSPHTGSSPERR